MDRWIHEMLAGRQRFPRQSFNPNIVQSILRSTGQFIKPFIHQSGAGAYLVLATAI
jgi:hypothetical protein